MLLDLLKTVPQYLIPQHSLNALAAQLAQSKQSNIKNAFIQWFVKKYQVNMHEALIEDPCAYACFNDFFIRHLKPSCRPMAKAAIISPVDGCISEIGAITKGQLLQAKGRLYSVAELLGGTDSMAAQFDEGRFATLYLSPKDYHRIHMPMDAQLVSMTYIPGSLFSVQPATARLVPKLFARNERLVVHFTTAAGPMVMVLVGALIVGAIGTSWQGDVVKSKNQRQENFDGIAFRQGDEMGYFKLGSTVVLLFADGRKVAWNKDLQAQSPIQFGQALGELLRYK